MSATTTDQLERARELMVTLREAAEELSTLYGPLWHEREALRRAASVTDGMVDAACTAQGGPDWRAYDASLEIGVRAGLEAALAVYAE